MPKYSFEISEDIEDCMGCPLRSRDMMDYYESRCLITINYVSLGGETRDESCPLVIEVSNEDVKE